MPARNTRQIAIIGFGEVGQTFARDLLLQDDIRVTAHDLIFASVHGRRNRECAAMLGVHVAQSAASASAGVDVIISAVTAAQAEAVALEARSYLKPGQIFLDVNSAAPSTKQRAASHVEATGAHYVECAVMAPVLVPGLRVPILAGGIQAAAAAQMMNGLGMNLTPVAADIGRASAMKLCRSIIIKGLEALMVDCAEAAARWDVQEIVFASLGETFPSIDWHALAPTMKERVATHGVRRSAEMEEAADMLAALGIVPDLARAVAQAQLRGAIQETVP